MGLQQKAENSRMYEVIKKGQSAFESQVRTSFHSTMKFVSLRNHGQGQIEGGVSVPVGLRKVIFDSANS